MAYLLDSNTFIEAKNCLSFTLLKKENARFILAP